MAFRHILAHGQAMHDREKAGSAKPAFFLPPIIREKPSDGGAAITEAGRRAGRDQRVNPPGCQRFFQRFPHRLHLEAIGQRNRDTFATGAPGNAARIHAVMITQNPAHPKCCGLLIFRQPNLSPCQISGTIDAAIGADIDRRMPKRAGKKHRHANIRRVTARAGDDMAAHG